MAGALTAAIAAAFSGGGAPPVTTDPYFEYTTLLLPGNGTNGAQNNTFLDSSTNNFTITRNGNTTQGTFSPFSQTGWGNYFDGSGDYLSVASNAAFQLGTGDFSIEAWIYPTTTPGGQYPVVIRLESGGYNSNGLTLFWRRYNVNPNGVSVDCGGAVSLAGTSTVALNTWTHVAVTRTGTTFALFVNGTREATTTSSNNFSVNDSVYIGDGTSDTEFPGYISNVRIVKGSNVYGVGATLTVPTEPLTAISGTSLLTCQSNRFIDNSTNNFTITKNGDTRVVAFSPFNPTASWSAATNGGSGYFDGSGDYLNASSSLFNPAGAFTAELWFYPTDNTTQYQGLISTWPEGAVPGVGIQFWKSGATFSVVIGNASTGGTTVASFTWATYLNQWNHLALVRNSSNSCAVFLNGNRLAAPVTKSGAPGQTSLTLGRIYNNVANYYFTGYMSDVRFVSGNNEYDPASSTITVPTAPLTAVPNTALLLNFTNAGIYDATSKNDLETLGAASISTAQSKWGGSSMVFNGSTSALKGPSTDLVAFGTGDFTVEAWAYRTATSDGFVFDTRNNGVGLRPNTSNQLEILVTFAGPLTAGGTWPANQWVHIAATRTGGNIKLWLDGVNVATAANSTNMTGNTPFVGSANGSNYFPGYIQDLRVTKGYARYTSNFTPPTAAFPTL
jgi:hypothetical protein